MRSVEAAQLSRYKAKVVTKIWSRGLRVAAVGLVGLPTLACGRGVVPPQAPPQVASSEPQVEPPPELEPPTVSKNPLPEIPPTVPGPPKACATFASRSLGERTVCELNPALTALDDALSQSHPVARDEKLALLESCQTFPRGWLRALRAELGPPECADAIAAPWLQAETKARAERASEPARGVPGDVEQVLVGLSIAARLRRLTEPVPTPPEGADREGFQEYFRQTLKPWMVNRARSVHQLSLQGSSLRGYARGVVAVEAAVADFAFVQAARAVPLPADMAADAAVREAYYAALDEALEPRKRRGRDAALVAMNDLANLGVIQSPRLQRARTVLAASYAGGRISALDRLLLPDLPPLDSSTAGLRVLATLPTFFVQHVLTSVDVAEPSQLRALLVQGVPPRARAHLDSVPLSAESAALYARALVALGQRYFRSAEFSRAAAVAHVVPVQGQDPRPENRLLEALALALKGGPKDAAHMMLGGPLLPDGFGNVEALDRLSTEQSSVAPLAAYDAATILAFLPPRKDVKQFWEGIARRYELAAKKLTEPAQIKDSESRARAAREMARAVR